MATAVHPQSVIRTPDGRQVDLKIHQCVWSGDYVPNSLPSVLDCYRAHVARAEIDIAMLRDQDFLVVHDLDLAHATDGRGRVDEVTAAQAGRLRLLQGGHPTTELAPLLSQVVAAIAAEPFPTLLELDLKDWKPWPWRRVEELARLVEPVRERVTFGGNTDTNLRRLVVVDPDIHVGYTLPDYVDWRTPDPAQVELRFEAFLAMVPTARELHVRLEDAVQLQADGVSDLTERVHGRGLALDAWTINAGTPRWQERLEAALRLCADVITTETPRELRAEALVFMKNGSWS
jgi:glycerophosphoryl diester phosphodiesterase